MSVRKKLDRKTGLVKIDEETGLEIWEAYWNARSKKFPNIRVQKVSDDCKSQEEAKKAEKKIIKEAIEEVARLEALGACWNAIVTAWEAESKLEDGTYLNPVTGKRMTAETVADTVGIIKNWTHDWLPIPGGELTRKHGKDVIRAAIEDELSQSRISRIKGSIQTIFDFGVQEGIIVGVKQSPVFGLATGINDQEDLPEILTIEEVKNLLLSAKSRSHEWYPVWALALTTGMRSSELYALRKENVLMNEGLIRITESWDWSKDQAKSTKGGYWRTAPIPTALMPTIQELMKTEGEFLLPRLKHWEDGMQAQVLRSFCEQIGIKSVRFHTLRACFATHLLASGVEDVKVMRIGGWRDFKTFEVYVRLSGIREKGLSDRLGQSILPSEQSALDHLGNLFTQTAA